MKCIVYSTDNCGRVCYFKSKLLNYNWTPEFSKAKRFTDEKRARIMIRELYLSDSGLYKVKYLEK